MLKGTILVSPEDTEEYFAFFVKNQITDNRPNKGDDSIANELLSFIYQTTDGSYHSTSPAKFLDLHAPSQFAKEILPPETVQSHEVMSWAFENITLPLFEETKVKVGEAQPNVRNTSERLSVKSSWTWILPSMKCR